MFQPHKEKSPEAFWREYEEKTGEKILGRGLGRYISGWDEFDSKGWNNIWGLIIASSGGLRFHHFPQRPWLDALTGQEPSKEKIIFIEKEKIISVKLISESRWWKKLLSSPVHKLAINFLDSAKTERRLLLEAEQNSGELAEKLAEIANSQESAATAAPRSDACSTGAME